MCNIIKWASISAWIIIAFILEKDMYLWGSRLKRQFPSVCKMNQHPRVKSLYVQVHTLRLLM